MSGIAPDSDPFSLRSSADGSGRVSRPSGLAIPGAEMHQSLDLGWRRHSIARRFSRRDFGRLAALMTAGAALPFYNESAIAQNIEAMATIPPDAVRINANENPMGPCPEAAE